MFRPDLPVPPPYKYYTFFKLGAQKLFPRKKYDRTFK